MTVTHESAQDQVPAPTAKPDPKPKPAKQPKLVEGPSEPSSAKEPATKKERVKTDQDAAKPKKRKGPVPAVTLEELAKRYIEHLAATGKSHGTCFSYGMEMKTAWKFLGAETLVGSLTPDDVLRFNNSKEVMLLKSGKPKAQPSFLKTQRVLRLALVWAVEQGWIESAPLPEMPKAN